MITILLPYYLHIGGEKNMKTNLKKITVKEDFFTENNVFMRNANLEGEEVLRVTKDPAITGEDEATYAKLQDSKFQDGVIEVKVLSRLLPDAPDYARGFIGVALRINENNSEFESFYVRPTNSRCDIQLRRNRTVQYFSYPNFRYYHSRQTNPAEYESYADIDLNEWIDIKIVIDGEHGKLYVNNAEQPVLVVNDMKHGANNSGEIGLFVDIGTEGFFKDLKYTPKK